MWLHSSTAITPEITPAFDGQRDVGWRLLTRGFLTRHWRIALHDAFVANEQHTHDTVPDLTKIMAGLIKVMWSSLGQLWLNHLSTIHQTDKTIHSPVTLDDLRNHIRHLHHQRTRTLPIHQHYFIPDVEVYLAKASKASMQSYIDHYEPIIRASIQDTTHHPLSTTPIIPHSPSPHQSVEASTRPHPAMEEPQHRKRNRRRLLTRIAQSIRLWTQICPRHHS